MPRGKGTGKGGPAAAATAAGPEISFEEALRRLEEVVAELERGEQPLERALALFEEGTRLSRLLTAKLEEAQARIDRVVEARGGGPKLEPFEGGPDEE